MLSFFLSFFFFSTSTSTLNLSSTSQTGSYGSTKRYKSFPRLTRANETTLVGAGGELSDFQVGRGGAGCRVLCLDGVRTAICPYPAM